jgi:hypothetical protein
MVLAFNRDGNDDGPGARPLVPGISAGARGDAQIP